jgi:hypothetical protein
MVLGGVFSSPFFLIAKPLQRHWRAFPHKFFAMRLGAERMLRRMSAVTTDIHRQKRRCVRDLWFAGKASVSSAGSSSAWIDEK